MSESEANLENLSSIFDKLNDIREQSLTTSREIVRECSKSIRNIHRNDEFSAKEHIENALSAFKKVGKGLGIID